MILTVLASMVLVALAVSSRVVRPVRRRRIDDGPENLAAHLDATWRLEVAATRARLKAVARHLITTRSPLTCVFVEDAAHLVFGDGTVVLLREPSPSGVRLLVDEVAADRPVRLGALHLTLRPTAGVARLERLGGSVPIAFDGAAVLAERHPAQPTRNS